MMRLLIAFMLTAILLAVQGCSTFNSTFNSMFNSAGGNSSEERRSSGSQIDDENIEKKTLKLISEKFKNNEAQINVTCFNRFVLLTGDATTKEIKSGIERIVYTVHGVKQIADEIDVGGLSSSSSRKKDAGITKDVQYEINLNKSLKPGTIKVVTDKGRVYLLGLIVHAEGKIAADTASVILGVQKVIKAFEYIDIVEP